MRDDDREVELIDYIEVALKRKWLILLGTLACMAGALVYLLSTAPSVPLYTASVQIYLVPSQAQGLKDTQIDIPWLTPEFYRAIALADETVMAMNRLQRSLIDSLGLRAPEPQLALEVKVPDNTRLEMKVVAADTLLARLVLYAWVDTFMEQTQELNATESSRYYAYISAQYDAARYYLEKAEDELLEFNRDNPISSLENQQAIYQEQFRAAQQQAIRTQIQLDQKEAQLRRAQEVVQALELGGEPLYSLSVAALAEIRDRDFNPLGRQLIGSMLEMERLKETQVQLEEGYNLALLELDQQYNFTQLQREVEELTRVVEGYQQSYLRAKSKQLTASNNLKALEAELKKHSPTLKSEELNPAYMELEQRRAREGLAYETALVYAEVGAQELKGLEERLEEVQRRFYEFQAKRQHLVEQGDRKRNELKKRIDGAQVFFESIQQSYLDAKRSVGDFKLRIEVVEKQLIDQQAQLANLGKNTAAIQDLLSQARTESERLDRDKKNFAATFERFARLLEEARIAQQKASTNLRIITRDVAAKPVGAESSFKKLPISGAVGLLLSTLLAFFLEYVHKARSRPPLPG